MSQFKTEHRGFTIVYSENGDVWRCQTLDVEAPTLSAIKRKVEVIERKSRAVESFPAFAATYGDRVDRVTVTAKALKTSAPGTRRYWDDKDGVWCVFEDGSRKKIPMTELVEDTPENRALIAVFNRHCDELKQATNRKKAALAAIPRMSADQIPDADPEIETEKEG